MANDENGREGTDSLQNTVAELREENAWLRRQLALRLFPPETAPPFDPSEYTLTTWDDILADLKTVEQE